MKFFVGCVLLIFVLCLTTVLKPSNAMWAKLTDTELVEKSKVIISAKLIGRTQISINKVKLVVGVLKVEEVLKGDKGQAIFLLALPPIGSPHKSTDIFYKDGQQGLWFLHEQNTKAMAGIYFADHPQRFLAKEEMRDKVKVFRKILNKS